jgi:hypothetical protein
MLLLSSGFTMLAQAPTPCGSEFNPCYVRPEAVRDAGEIEADIAAIHAQFTASPSECMQALKVANDALDRQESLAKSLFSWAFVATVLALIGVVGVLANWKNIFDAWKRSELSFSLPVNIKRLAYIFITPVVAGVLGGVLLRAGEWFVAAKAPSALGLFTVGAFVAAGAVLGFLSALDIKEFPTV